jgi:Fe-S cluster assembly ATP-binding protein
LRACSLTELDDAKPFPVEVGGVEIVVVRQGDEVFAIRDECSHACRRAVRGRRRRLRDRVLAARLDLLAAHRRRDEPAGDEPVPVYPVTIDGDDVLVDVTSPLPVPAARRPATASPIYGDRRDLMAILEIRDLHVSVDTENGPKEILRGVDLTIAGGQTHAIMGPNGSGKSTLAYSIAGHPKYNVTSGTVTLDGEDVLGMAVDERARAGLFLAMQYPVEVPGVSVSNFLRTAKTAIDGEAPKLRTWVKDVNKALADLDMDADFGTRNVNEGFSGGEKKRHEIVQLELLDPKIAILDETDSGLDIDALKVVSTGVNRFAAKGDKGVLLITHYTRILRYIKPDFVHVFVDGRVAEEGGPELADELEANGYERFLKAGVQA